MINRQSIEFYTWLFIRLSIVSYFLHKWKQINFFHAFFIIFAWFHWNTIGITIVAIYIVHKIINYLQYKNETETQGRVVGGSCDGLISSETVQDNHKQRSCLLKSVMKRQENTTSLNNTKRIERVKNLKKRNRKKKSTIVTRRKRENEFQREVEKTINDDIAVKLPPLSSSKVHPGLDAFHVWYSAISDLYRMYTIGKIGEEAPVPKLPRSENGRVRVEAHVTNLMMDDIDVYWVDYKGREVFKGFLRNNSTPLNIGTWVGHPWTFRRRKDQQLLLHFVPFRVLPSTFDEGNVIENQGKDSSVGHYEFFIAEPDVIYENEACSIIDKHLPYPPTKILSINQAMEISCQQMEREDINPSILLKYLYKIVSNPSVSKFRQIRTNNKIFWNNVWINGGRGILHALGFQECGAFIEMGPDTGPLPSDRLRDVTNAIVMLEELSTDMENPDRKQYIRQLGMNQDSGRAGWHN